MIIHSIRVVTTTLLFSGIILVAGCATSARMLQRDAVLHQIHKGQTQQEVRRVFGNPRRMEEGSGGRQLDVYFVVGDPNPFAMASIRTIEVRSLCVLYNADNLVEDFTFHVGNTTGTRTGFGGEWRAGRLLGLDDVDRIEQEVTTRDRLVEMFGPATVEGLDVYGYKTMSWIFERGRQLSSTGMRELVVRLNENGVVRDYLLRNVTP